VKTLALILGVLLLLLGVAVVGVVALVPSCSGFGSPMAAFGGTFEIDTVTFDLDTTHSAGGTSGIGPVGGGPGIWIDTNVRLRGLWGGTVRSSEPYAIAFDRTDELGELATLEFTRVDVLYDDGTMDPGAAALRLPIVATSREVETVNSVAGGRVVRGTVRVLSGRIHGAITRDESFRLVIEGRFIRTDGSAVPFAIDQRWDVVVEQATRPAGEVLQDR
jgi:hypothetical protein